MYRKLLDVKAVELKIELSYAGDEIISYFSSLIVCKEKIRKVDLKIEGSDSYYQHIFDWIGALTGLREVTAKIDNKGKKTKIINYNECEILDSATYKYLNNQTQDWRFSVWNFNAS